MASKSKEEASSDSDDSSTSRSSSPEQPTKVKSAVKEAKDKKREKNSKSVKQAKEDTAESSDPDSEEESSSEGENDNESASSSSGSEDEETAPSKVETTKPASTVSFYHPQAFKPPSGFKAVKKQSPPSSSVSSLLSNLRGKQVFHVTAPSFLPLSKVKEVSLAKVMQGEPVLTHEGVNYGIPAENLSRQDGSGKTLLLYDTTTQTYYSAAVTNIPSYHVQEMISIPKGKKNDMALRESVKPPKPQPKHLKMRFRPVGSGEGPPETIGSSSESEGEEARFKVPKGEERKRKHQYTEADGNQPGGLPRKKPKKQTSSQDNEAPSSQMEISSPNEQRGREKSKKSQKNRDETSQERKARREEKKRRKAEKAT